MTYFVVLLFVFAQTVLIMGLYQWMWLVLFLGSEQVDENCSCSHVSCSCCHYMTDLVLLQLTSVEGLQNCADAGDWMAGTCVLQYQNHLLTLSCLFPLLG